MGLEVEKAKAAARMAAAERERLTVSNIGIGIEKPSSVGYDP